MNDWGLPSNLFNSKATDDWPQKLTKVSKPKYPLPLVLPCANVEPKLYHACRNPGTMACSSCKLVSYCSKDCQTTHWHRHKKDCKNSLRSTNWKPSWTVEQRLPLFIMGEPGEEWSALSMAISLWGNTPAMDVIGLPNNENDATKDFSLAFIASGDLRHVVRTLNCLPSNYSGKLKVLLNDHNVPIVCRNIVILMILATTPDKTMAADIALHFWYSVFMPVEYCITISAIITLLLKRACDQGFGSLVIPLGQNSSLTCTITKPMNIYFQHYISTSFSIQEIQAQYDKGRNAPGRGDYRDKMYAALRPSHRIAFQQFRRFGLMLPCGAPNVHFKAPNLSLFSQKGEWLETDYADPLEGWDVGDVVKVGKAYGANAEDIYGCLYFFLFKQLRGVADRLQTTSTSFFVQMLDACDLGRKIREGSLTADGIPSSIRFDRIEVSNIIDANYVGLNNVLTSWSPLLCDNRTAAIVGYFMNWFMIQGDGRASGAGGSVDAKLMGSLLDKVKQGTEWNHMNLIDMKTKIYILADVVDTLYDNSKPFSEFLKKQGINDILKKTGLILRRKHSIVPPRLHVPLKAKPNALPQFSDDDSWYYNTLLTSYTWAERFVEFARR